MRDRKTIDTELRLLAAVRGRSASKVDSRGADKSTNY
jgi:hypothetical protein